MEYSNWIAALSSRLMALGVSDDEVLEEVSNLETYDDWLFDRHRLGVDPSKAADDLLQAYKDLDAKLGNPPEPERQGECECF